jgi:hypothetical protein
MQNVGIMEARPPFIRFERRAREGRDEQGLPKYVDQDFALVTAHGSKDTVEKVVAEWFPRLREEVRQGRFDPRWLAHYEAAYNAWKSGEDLPLDGLSVKMWPAASAGEVKALLAANCFTVELLAEANEEMIHRLGMGGRSLKQRAVDWQKAMKGHAPLVAQLDTLRQTNTSLQARLQAMEQQVLALTQALGAAGSAGGSPPQRQEAPTEHDDTDDLIGDAIAEQLGS